MHSLLSAVVRPLLGGAWGWRRPAVAGGGLPFAFPLALAIHRSEATGGEAARIEPGDKLEPTGGDAPVAQPEPDPAPPGDRPRRRVRGWFSRLLGRSAPEPEPEPNDRPFLFSDPTPDPSPEPDAAGLAGASEAPPGSAGDSAGGDDPTLSERIDELAIALRDREQDLRGVGVELSVLGQAAADSPAPARPGHAASVPLAAPAADDASRERVLALEAQVSELYVELERRQSELQRARTSLAELAAREPQLPPALLEEMEVQSREVTAARERLREREEMLVQAEASTRNTAFALRAAEQRVAALNEQLATFKRMAENRSAELFSQIAELEADRDHLAGQVDDARAGSARDLREAIQAVDDIRAEWELAEKQLIGQLEQHTKHARAVTSELARREEELQGAGERVRQLSEELGRTRTDAASERARSQKAVADLKERVQALAVERESLTRNLSEKSALSTDLDFKLTARVEEATKLKKELERQQGIAQERLQDLKKAQVERDHLLAQAHAEVEVASREASELRAQASVREQRLRDLENRIPGFNAEKETREREYVTLRSRLEADLGEATAALEDRERQIRSLQDQRNSAEMLRLELEDKVREAARRLEGRTKEFRDAYAKKEEEARKSTESLTQRESQLRLISAEVKERERTRQAELDRLESKVKDKDAEINNLLKMLSSKADALRGVEEAKAREATRAVAMEQQARASEEKVVRAGAEARAASEKIHAAGVAAQAAEQRAQAASALSRTAEERAQTLARDLARATGRVAELEGELRDLRAAAPLATATPELEEERAAAESARARDGDLIARLREAVAERDTQLEVLRHELATRERHADAVAAGAGPEPMALPVLDEAGTAPARPPAALSDESSEIDGLFDTGIEDAELPSPVPRAPAAGSAGAALPASRTRPVPASPRRPLRLGLASAASLALATAIYVAWSHGLVGEAAPKPRPIAARADLPLTPAGPAEREQASAFVRAWASAIEHRDWKGYLAMYEPTFVPPELTDRKSFESSVIELFRTAEWLAVDLEQLQVERGPDSRIVASFPLEIRAQGHLDFGRRQIGLSAQGGSLRIDQDRWVP